MLLVSGCSIPDVVEAPSSIRGNASEYFWAALDQDLIYDVYLDESDVAIQHTVELRRDSEFIHATDRANGETGHLTTRLASQRVAITDLRSSALFPLPAGAFISAHPQSRNVFNAFPVTALHISAWGELAATKSGVYTRRGSTWQASSTVIAGHVTAFASSTTNIYAGTSLGEVLYSNDGGSIWQALPGKLGAAVTALAIDSSREVFAAVSGHGVFLSSNHQAFSPIGGSLPSTNISGIALISPDGIKYAAPQLFVATMDQGIFALDRMAYGSWTVPYAIISQAPFDVSSVSVAEDKASLVAGTQAGRVYVSSDRGSSWISIQLDEAIVKVAILDPMTIAAATDSGNIYSIDVLQRTSTLLGAIGAKPTGLAFDLQRALWISSARGLRRLTPANVLEDLALGTESIDTMQGELTLLRSSGGELALGSSWHAGNLAMPLPTLGLRWFEITARITERLDLLQVDGSEFTDVVGVRYAHETNGDLTAGAPYWMIYYAKGVGPVLIDQLQPTNDSPTKLSRAILRAR